MQVLKSERALPIGEQIRAIRKSRKIRQGVLAEMAGISQACLSYVENDARNRPPNSETLKKIAMALNCDVVCVLIPKE